MLKIKIIVLKTVTKKYAYIKFKKKGMIQKYFFKKFHAFILIVSIIFWMLILFIANLIFFLIIFIINHLKTFFSNFYLLKKKNSWKNNDHVTLCPHPKPWKKSKSIKWHLICCLKSKIEIFSFPFFEKKKFNLKIILFKFFK